MPLSAGDKLDPFEIEALIGGAWARCTQPATRGSDGEGLAREDFAPRLTVGDTARLFGTLAEGGSAKMPLRRCFGLCGMRSGGPVWNSLGDQL